jgi:hypothetical protein
VADLTFLTVVLFVFLFGFYILEVYLASLVATFVLLLFVGVFKVGACINCVWRDKRRRESMRGILKIVFSGTAGSSDIYWGTIETFKAGFELKSNRDISK